MLSGAQETCLVTHSNGRGNEKIIVDLAIAQSKVSLSVTEWNLSD